MFIYFSLFTHFLICIDHVWLIHKSWNEQLLHSAVFCLLPEIISLNSSSTRWIRRSVRPQIAREYRNKISARSCNLKRHQKRQKKWTEKKEREREMISGPVKDIHTHTHSYYPTAVISFLKQNECRDMSFARHKRNRRTELKWRSMLHNSTSWTGTGTGTGSQSETGTGTGTGTERQSGSMCAAL